MEKGRLEAFSDGVFAVIITIMVLELKMPQGSSLGAIAPQRAVFLAYVVSFLDVGIFWVNHHHLLAATKRVDGRILWANLHLLFWLSFVPFTTAWAGSTAFASIPVAVFAADLFLCGVAYKFLRDAILALAEADSELARVLGNGWKPMLSLACYVVSIPIAFAAPLVSVAIFGLVAVLWFVPDRRIERLTSEAEVHRT